MIKFKEWILQKEAVGNDVKTRVKTAISQQANMPGATAKEVAEKELKKASQEVNNDPNAPISTSVEIGMALDKTKNNGNAGATTLRR